ncbi:MAG: phosphate ABC transporter, permease protein PstA [Rhodobacteraceae bacterium]|jgi:phosphate transport system permease protein|uniref:Phosphate transport system permease protein PstA n=1 Tax=Salipiger profundus TaxID=1229727 RepID=A0A1U7D9U9_9RHOB|nr:MULTISPECIES: phosphate ABC transporter permease PstA [Salipiger]APX24882.1 phosphate ABC transporter membrane protein 2, PhoT family [Salipiger profundus]MAB07796.1 phosphate ABC transporter, permease protein PstA [Paracoccaceae bacterium]GFZ98559.1 phosphate transport system permease protein PstA [Salipiger profundus]SFC96197.1 phosphate ABC transporter membrane protein 2, PhoT family [Salipiger profundus]
MTDASMEGAAAPRKGSSIHEIDARTRKRNASEKRFKAYGITAILIGLFFLVVLAVSIVRSGAPAFTKTVVDVEFTLSQAEYEEAESTLFKTKAYSDLFVAQLRDTLRDDGVELEFDAAAIERLLGKVGGTLREFYTANEGQLGEPVSFQLPASSRVDGYFNGRVTRDALQDSRFLQQSDLDLVDALAESGVIRQGFNWTFITGADSGVDNPGGAGIGASVVGSFFMMLVVLVLALPIGVAASIYLEEFAPQNKFTDLIEVNISNLAAVPSIVFGILGLAVFIQFMHLPQSAPVVGGLVLTLMTLPTIIISTRASLKSVPPSIRDAALGVGASKMQAVFHHVLPLAMPGILTGTIIGLAQALGETAPLLLIGMVGFVARGYPDGFVGGFTEPNSAMPAQIYTWAARADASFYEKAWGGIIILLIFLLAMNVIAIILRRKFERRW